MTHDRFEVLFVCHANLCRSPMAERLANRAFADRIGVRGSRLAVSSAGTHARPGRPMHPATAHVLSERGAYPGQFESRLLTPPILARPDLVLTATREQRAACLRMVPGAARHTFTLRQFGRLAVAFAPAAAGAATAPHATITADSPARRLQALLGDLATGGRPQPVDDDDLADPVRRPMEEFRRCADDIQRVLDVLVAVIAPR
jgi:protein-tyrosine phosphatase